MCPGPLELRALQNSCKFFRGCTPVFQNISKTNIRLLFICMGSIYQTLIKQIEAVQNRAARFVTGNHSRRSSVTAMKLKLKWEPLELRRNVGRLTNFYEAIAGRLAIPVRSALCPAGRNLRHTSTTNSYMTFFPIPANKNCYKFSFIPRKMESTAYMCNSIMSIQDKTIFKTAAHNHLIEQSNHN